ncbi:chaperonin 10-like protein [Aspergillus pseudodeflectus]|uniref:Chaperonin 10-like protein n=1 Tax=Aspergillus pseudodeflectus TaxID=176178 RepID=A0ABR4KGA6_9EURO
MLPEPRIYKAGGGESQQHNGRVLWTGIPLTVTVPDVPVPSISNPTDVRVRVTAAAICGTDLRTYHGIYGSSSPPWIICHGALGVIESVGSGAESLQVGDHIAIPDTLDSGPLNMARAGGFEVGDTVAIFGAIFGAVLSACFRPAPPCDAVHPARLEPAGSIGAIPISVNSTGGDPAAEILRLEPGDVARAVACVGYGAVNPTLDRLENAIILDMGAIGVVAAPGKLRGTPRAGDLSGLVQFPTVKFSKKWLEELVTLGRMNLDFIVSSMIGIEEAPEYHHQRFDQDLEPKVFMRFP